MTQNTFLCIDLSISDSLRSVRKSVLIYETIICRQSGLSDHQWCLEHDINPGTFYNWVRRFRKQACEFPAPAGKDRFQAVHQEVVKMEIIPDHPSDFFEQPSMEDSVEITKPVAAMELQIGKAVLRISNQTDPRLLEQTLKLLGAFSC